MRSALPAVWNKTASGGRDTSLNRIKQVRHIQIQPLLACQA